MIKINRASLSNKINDLRIPYAQAVHNQDEEKRVLSVLREHRTIMGKEVSEFEKRVAKEFGKRYGLMVNSGSSALTMAIDLMNLPPGSEVITPVLTFSTTIAPLIKNRLVPVFADVELGKFTINISQIEKLITKKTKALLIPLLLGSTPDMIMLSKIAKKNKLFFIEDSCDTFGPKINGKPTSKFSDMTVTSFYGSHIITAGGGGGMLMVNSSSLLTRAKMLRGWGRSSSKMNESEKIEKRFGQSLDDIPYDAKFIFDEIGYNFMPMELGAAFGNAQLDKLNLFKKIRTDNFRHLSNFFKDYQDFFNLPFQEKNIETQWLAFPLIIKDASPFSRLELVKYLETNNIQTRPIFTGNILRQPGFRRITHKSLRRGYPEADKIMRQGFVIGCHHGLASQHLQKIEMVFNNFFRKYIKI